MSRNEYDANRELNETAKANKRTIHAHHSPVIIPPQQKREVWRSFALAAFAIAVLFAFWYGNLNS